MINIQRTGNAIVIDFTDNDKYLNNGTIEVAPNELMIVIDESNMATFKKMSNGDTLFGQLIDQIQIQGENVTKDNIIEKFGIIGFSAGGGGGEGGAVNSVNGQTGDVVITATSLGAITKANADAAYASKSDLNSKADTSTVEALSTEVAANETAITNLTSKVNEDSEKIADLDTEMGTKQATLVSGQNIKTINNQSILGEGNIDITGGGTITVDSELSTESENPVQNKVITTALNDKASKAELATKQDSINKYVSSITPNPQATGFILSTIDINKQGEPTITSFQLNNTKDPDIEFEVDRTNPTEPKSYIKLSANVLKKAVADQTYASKDELTTKQDTLVSGTNIKTINGETILGEGDLTISSQSRTWRFTYSSSITSSDSATITPDGFTSQEWLSQVAIGDMVYLDKGQEFMKLSVSNIYHPTTGNIKVGLSFYSDRLYWVLVTGSAFTLKIHTVPIGKTSDATAFGEGAAVTASGSYGVAIGYSAKSNGYNAIAIGNYIQEDEQMSINIGDYLKVSHSNGFSYWDGTQMRSLKDQLAALTPLTVDTAMSDTSENAVQNKVIKKYIDDLVGNILTQLQEINGTN